MAEPISKIHSVYYVQDSCGGRVSQRKKFVCQGTNDRGAHPKRWVATLVQMNCEKKVAAKLDKMGIANYVPTQKEVHNWSDRRKVIHRVVIPSIVFVRISQDAEDEFRRLSYIRSIIKNPGAKEIATPIPDKQIEQIQFLLKHSESPVIFSAHIEIGDAVRIVKGPLKDFIGYCCGMSHSDIAIYLYLLGYAMTHISNSDIKILK